MSLTTAWVVPTKDDVVKYVQQSVIDGANALNSGGEERIDGPTGLLQAAVDQVRGAVGNGNRVALSLTANSVPPEARAHVMVLAAYMLVSSVPQLGDFASKDGLTRRWDEANKWLDAVRRGDLAPAKPTDPDTATAPAGPTWGDFSGEQVAGVAGRVDVSTDGV